MSCKEVVRDLLIILVVGGIAAGWVAYFLKVCP